MTDRSRTATPSEQELSDIIALSVGAGAHDEAVRAVVNYLWSACRFDPLDALERTVAEAVRELGVGLGTEAYGPYLQFSLATLVYVPAGRWADADAVLSAEALKPSASNRLVWLWLVTGLALRRGDLEQVDRYLPEFRETALASEEPQRILPMASIAIPRALLEGNRETIRRLADIVLVQSAYTTSMAALSISRSLAEAGEVDRAVQLAGLLAADPGSPPEVEAAQGLLALFADRAGEAAERLLVAEDGLRSLGRHYDAACIALEVGRALNAVGDAKGAGEARGRAAEMLNTLGCVNPW
jgi:hypothetical protein